MVAERFLQAPDEVICFAMRNLDRWRQQGVDCEDFGIWKELLSGPRHAILDVLTSTSEEAIQLRQSSPFAGLISEEARLRILASAN